MTTPQQALVRSAARNNAEWCAVMCRAHEVDSGFGREAWAAARRTPLYYPDAVTLEPGADPEALVARIDTVSPGASVKDSFADLDLTGAGFRVLFGAEWIHRAAGLPVAAPDLAWDVVSDPGALRDWALAWDDGGGNADLFGPGLLDAPETFVLAGRSADGRVAVGAVAGRSSHVVGVSNVFGPPDVAWPLVLHTVGRLFPALPVVGYEGGDDLAAALRHGFEPVGPLRVWMHERSA
ncbi:hypothetical protein [Streptomyces cahuitamycinicus]|uniref:Uncharacterized protein n=1 Tax=Streptomyces cahuitamycinicus TaxID=2070367 RepID=A0A2N8TK18_9ACTN|nr:hypothetical protein [Streptomyces cahuitamycinicus]PNG19367.1 hypothetical protein C1J00_25995 [Streptomyces cahuitamycinicus]